MLFSKKRRSKSGQVYHTQDSLYPVLHVTGSLEEYKKDLINKEVESLFELGMVGSSFAGVMDKANSFQTKLQRDSLARCGRTLHRPCGIPRTGWRN